MQTNFIPRPVPALFFASALGLIFAGSSAAAQDYGRYGDEPRGYQGEPNETVIVPVPRYYEPYYYREQRGRLNGDIVNVSLSSEVRFDDLDLRTRWGVDELRSRIRLSARDVCDQLERRYPVAADNSPPCYREAVEDAMDQADAAIARARGYAEADWRR